MVLTTLQENESLRNCSTLLKAVETNLMLRHILQSTCAGGLKVRTSRKIAASDEENHCCCRGVRSCPRLFENVGYKEAEKVFVELECTTCS